MKLVIALFLLSLSVSASAKNIVEGLNSPGQSQDLTIPRITGSTEPTEPPIVTAIGKLLSARLELMRDRKEKYGSMNFSVGDRWTYSCAETCSCLTRRFAEVLKAHNIPFRTLVIHQGRDFRVILRSHHGPIGPFDYHEVTAIRVAGRWRIVDVLSLGSTQLEPLADWVKRIENPQLKRASIY